MDQNQTKLAKFCNADLEVKYPGVLKSENAGNGVSHWEFWVFFKT